MRISSPVAQETRFARQALRREERPLGARRSPPMSGGIVNIRSRRAGLTVVALASGLLLCACGSSQTNAGGGAGATSAAQSQAGAASSAPVSLDDVLKASTASPGMTFQYSDTMLNTTPGQPDVSYACAGTLVLQPQRYGEWACHPSKALGEYMVSKGIASSVAAQTSEVRLVGRDLYWRYPNADDHAWNKQDLPADGDPSMVSAAGGMSPLELLWLVSQVGWDSKPASAGFSATGQLASGGVELQANLAVKTANGRVNVAKLSLHAVNSTNGAQLDDIKTLTVARYGKQKAPKAPAA